MAGTTSKVNKVPTEILLITNLKEIITENEQSIKKPGGQVREKDDKISQLNLGNQQLTGELGTIKEDLERVRGEKLEMAKEMKGLQKEISDLEEILKRKQSPSQK